MAKHQKVIRGARLDGEALQRHLKAVASECGRTGSARIAGIRSETRALSASLAILRARLDAEALTPAAQWFVDNARLLEEACASLREALRAAPRLPACHGEARVHRLARECVGHIDARVTGETLLQAAQAWQTVEPLTESELCHLPLAARRTLLALLAELATSAAQTEWQRTHAEATLNIREKNRPDAYWERLCCLLQEREDAEATAKLDARFSELGQTAAELAHREHDRQARACLWAGNAIASLKALSTLDWRATQESLSAIDAWLRGDPTGVYPRMDFASRAMYRRRVAKLASRFHAPEAVVARKALSCAENVGGKTVPELARHVGYYLMDGGQPLLWQSLGKTPRGLRAALSVGKRAATLYVLLIFIGSTAVGALLWLFGVRSWLTAPGLLIAGEAFRQLVGLIVHRLSPPRRMPRLAPDQLDDGDVLIVVPTLLTSRAHALEMARHLSVLRLANPETRLSYMLLADFKDGPAAVEPDDAEIFGAALSAVNALNDVWGGGFYYLHRAREWNERAGRFMGRERKRGALAVLNGMLLTGETDARFDAATCGADALKSKFRTVITLDADTQLPPGTALELAGMIQHPLNKALTVDGKRRGCAVIQPRMETSAGTVRTRIARLWGGDGGFDPYITAFSDVYQNLCGEGSFAGKGVYDAPAFEAAVANKIRDNTVLSHDLLEGALAGASLACDIALYDSQPQTLSGWMKRLHRWTRGDWQLLPWLMPWVRGKNGRFRNPLSALNQFKIYDNLRRSLVPAASLLMIIAGVWADEPVAFAAGLLLPHVRALMPATRRSLAAAASHIAMLPFEAKCLLDAALRTVWRVLFSRKRLLEWLPSHEAERQNAGKSSLRFWPNYVCGALLLLAAVHAPAWLFAATPVSALFFSAPLVAKWLDGAQPKRAALPQALRDFLLDTALRTLRFFEATVTDKTHHLPPDNLQVDPPRGVAERTSPTNIGMYLIACVSACELSLLEADEAARRVEKTVSSLERMEKWNGHLFNWYDTRTLEPLSGRYVSSVDSGNLAACLLLAAQAMRAQLSRVDASLLSLPARLDALAASMDFSKLYNPAADLFYVGVHADSGTPDSAHYDLLASESRLTSYIALMRREVPLKHWHRLGRAMTGTRGGSALLSWSGTMFEYLLPAIFLHSPHGTLLSDTGGNVVREQMSAFDGMPWGVSESGYCAFDTSLSYQYRAFGLPRLALKTARLRRVVAPYAAALALSVSPRGAADNLRAMADLGWMTDMGFYEAADWDAEKGDERLGYRLVKSHMAHHQGMILAAVCNALTEGALTRHFHGLPQVEAYALLLEERKPGRPALRSASTARLPETMRWTEPTLTRKANAADFPPETQVMYGGGTTLTHDARGNGYISHNGLMLTRRRPDPLYEGGIRFYLRYPDGEIEPFHRAAEIRFDRSRAEFSLSRDGATCEMTCFVSPLDGVAVHWFRLHAPPSGAVDVEIASFLEVCLSSQQSDESHPAFRNLSIVTERLSPTAALARRRTKDASERYPLLVHAAGSDTSRAAALETSRAAFLGRGERLDRPRALEKPFDIAAGEVGVVLDPCVSLRVPLRAEAGETRHLWFLTGAVADEADARALASRYASPEQVASALSLAETQDDVLNQYLGLDQAQRLTAQRLASFLLYPLAPGLPLNEGRSALWRFSISGDLPVLAVRVSGEAHMPLVRSALKATAYLRAVGVWSDLAIIDETTGGYRQTTRDALLSLIASSPSREWIGRSAGVHIADAKQHGQAAIDQLLAHATLVLDGGKGGLSGQLAAKRRTLEAPDTAGRFIRLWPPPSPPPPESLALGNGFGGFLADGSYMIHRETPAPWCNVLANERFGTVVTERGAGFTWHENSRLKRITAHASDPVRDMRGEWISVRDEDDGGLCTPFDSARTTHGFGFTRYETAALGLLLDATVFVDAELPVKCTLLTVENTGDTQRNVSVTAAVRWLLGAHQSEAAQVSCETFDSAVVAKSPACPETAFLAMPGRRVETSTDGAAVLLTGTVRQADACPDVPCGALRTRISLAPEAKETVCVLLGAGEMEPIVAAYRGGGAQARLANMRAVWNGRLDALAPRVPDAQTALMLGRWLPYQAISSRLFARAGFYQAGGAIGFRDQLQDLLALLHTDPGVARARLLDAAAHQFEAGDVQHWWHPPALGVRTRITDDRLFLPYIAVRYVNATGDASLFDEEVPYLEDVEIPEGADDRYCAAKASALREPMRAHMLRAINSVRYGTHGLPLIGGGDWNDGMNAIGAGNRGESVWLAFFLAAVLRDFAPHCDFSTAETLRARRDALMRDIETHAWDGDWYLRAWFDDGARLGSRHSDECKIDLVVQAWAVLAGANRAEQAFNAALERLYDDETGLIRLLEPPFDGGCEPGYIRAYPPGIRENGGQYTHAAAWFVLAAAKLGKTSLAWKLFMRLLPTAHSRDEASAVLYAVEPYVVAADIAAGAREGRGGWTWYTGSAALLWSIGMESLLGFEKNGDSVRLVPTAPDDWPGYTVEYRFGGALYRLRAARDVPDAGWIRLVDDGQAHEATYAITSRAKPQIAAERAVVTVG